jgi:uncharacterized protein (TIGR02246 family)
MMQAETKAQIEFAVLQWAERLNSHDPAQVAALYAPDATLWGTTSPALATTPAGIRTYFEQALSVPMPPKAFVVSQHIQFFGEVVISSGRYDLTFGSGTEAGTVPGRFTMAFERRADRWLIVNHHSSIIPVAPAKS